MLHSFYLSDLEMGHNWGLAHSGERGVYDDQTGMVSLHESF